MPGRGRWQRLRFWLRARQGIPWCTVPAVGPGPNLPKLGRSTNLHFLSDCPSFFHIVSPCVSFNFPQVLDSVKLFQFSRTPPDFPWFCIDFQSLPGLGRRALRLAPPWRGPWPSAASWLGAAGRGYSLAIDFFFMGYSIIRVTIVGNI